MYSNKTGFKLLYSFTDKIYGFSYAIQNTKNRKIRVKLCCQNSENMLFSTSTQYLEKTIEPFETEFMMHTIADPEESTYKRIAECVLINIDE